jgi:hypothetical protein
MREQLSQGTKSSGNMTSGSKTKCPSRKGDTQKFTQRPCDKQRVVKSSVFHPKNYWS